MTFRNGFGIGIGSLSEGGLFNLPTSLGVACFAWDQAGNVTVTGTDTIGVPSGVAYFSSNGGSVSPDGYGLVSYIGYGSGIPVGSPLFCRVRIYQISPFVFISDVPALSFSSYFGSYSRPGDFVMGRGGQSFLELTYNDDHNGRGCLRDALTGATLKTYSAILEGSSFVGNPHASPPSGVNFFNGGGSVPGDTSLYSGGNYLFGADGVKLLRAESNSTGSPIFYVNGVYLKYNSSTHTLTMFPASDLLRGVTVSIPNLKESVTGAAYTDIFGSSATIQAQSYDGIPYLVSQYNGGLFCLALALSLSEIQFGGITYMPASGAASGGVHLNSTPSTVTDRGAYKNWTIQFHDGVSMTAPATLSVDPINVGGATNAAPCGEFYVTQAPELTSNLIGAPGDAGRVFAGR